MAADQNYYRDELDYLDKAGREYARLHGERASYLGLEDIGSRDPHVERLIQSFAVLTGRVHQRLDDDFPELTHALMDLVWPHYLRPIPSVAMLQFEPKKGQIEDSKTIPRGFQVRSQRTSQEVRCEFRTVYPVTLSPISLEEAQIVVDDAGQRRLRFSFRLLECADPEKIQLDQLRIFLMGEPSVTFCAYRLLLKTVSAITLRFGKRRGPTFDRNLEDKIRSVGFAEDEDLVPYSDISFPGYRLLTEYFCFPDKFLFVDFLGLGGLDLERHEDTFELILDFAQRPPDNFRPTADNFQLHVTPIVNLLQRDGKPIRITHLKQSEEVVGDFTHPTAYEVLSVDEVLALREGDTVSRQRHAFYSFDHDRQADAAETHDGAFYQVNHRRNGPAGRWQTKLSLISAETAAELPRPETLSLELTCMNGSLCDELGIKTITGHAEIATFKNITRPTSPIYPDLGDGAEWDFISHMALNSLSLADGDSLRRILQLYNLGKRRVNQWRIDGIRQVSARPAEQLIGGAPVRGTELAITVEESHFPERGDLLLFSKVLNEFFALYASSNSFTKLIIFGTQSEEDPLECPRPISGLKSLI